ncbi:flavin-containing monooxygenase [Enhygromyxa salina]|uniref:4-hydroxyacetophenone monooxygenase n=1 Tax=Enhygromyxa salina TaxID=215803 RepID=A0A2S9YVP4_9BACT|nr:NAD(P)/FAD-dependent oxidoreductase [Enhygromyxa salina]PRQ09175.1 4-hydroxyacetophenone monooxygenase [Enhygromyxa salina]
MARSGSEHVHVAIVGAGFSGVGAAIRLRQAGIHDFVVFERGDEVGGVWRDNRYPGCACDVESPLYSYSFAPNPEWSRMFSPQGEILDYVRRCASEFGVLPHVRFGHAISEAAWNPATKRWQLDGPRGQFTADVLVAGMGALSEPWVPGFRGIERFEGPAFHSARWDPDAALDGQRVAVVGTGASAIQIVPRIQQRVGQLRLFQRTAPWVLPRRDRAFKPVERQLFANLPITQKLLRVGLYLRHESLVLGFRNPSIMRVVQRQALRYLHHQIEDPQLRERLRPDFTLGCKRVLLSDDYYPALAQDNVELVSAGIRELVSNGIVDTEGRLHELDAIIWATGFHVANPPFAKHVRGRSGESLAEVWRGSPTAHLGSMVAGFPNLFLLTGPNTGLGHSSMLLMIEAQLELLLGVLRELDGREAVTVEPDPAVQARYVDQIDRGGKGTVWTAGGCASWYLDQTGRNSTLWPWSTHAYMRRAKFERGDYVVDGV